MGSSDGNTQGQVTEVVTKSCESKGHGTQMAHYEKQDMGVSSVHLRMKASCFHQQRGPTEQAQPCLDELRTPHISVASLLTNEIC